MTANGTVRGNLVYYNRVSKAGSTTMLALAKRLASENGFRFLNAPSSAYHQPEQADVRGIRSVDLPFFYANHHEIINPGSPVWRRSGRDKHGAVPIFINILREPVSRYRSAFDYKVDIVNRSPRRVRQVIDNLKGRDPKCNCWDYSKDRQMPFNDCILGLALKGCSEQRRIFRLGGQATFTFLLNLEESKHFYRNKYNLS
eukprot:4362295-Pyramimonas_sp.AAC.1